MSKVNELGLLNDDVVEKFARKIYDVADHYGFDAKIDACRRIANEWNKQKSGLRAILRKHPMWDEERQMIWFDADISRSLEWQAIGDFWRNIENELTKPAYKLTKQILEYDLYYPDEVYFINERTDLNRKVDELYENAKKARAINDAFDGIRDQFFTEEKNKASVDMLNTINPEYKLRYNEKTSKAINKICILEGWNKPEMTGTYDKHVNDGGGKGNNYDRWYANLCDNLNPMVITRHTLISINPLDYLLMSHGQGGWHSCHWIGDKGCYCAGTTSYMLDSDSIIMYTVDKSFDGTEIEKQPKMTRQVFGYNDEVMCQLRLYPQKNDYGAEHAYQEMREIMQKVIAECEGKVNRWKTSHNDVEDIVAEDHYYACYPDWKQCNPGGEHAKISYFRDRDESKPKVISFGATPVCVCCGRKYDDTTESICCQDCDEDGYTCENCGCYLREDDAIWVGDYPYCTGCCVYCDDCGEYETRDSATWIESEHRYVCEYCLDQNYSYCDECGEYYHNDYIYYAESEDIHVCEECKEREFMYCEECDELFRKSELTEINGKYLCEYCIDNNYYECEECGEYVEKCDAEEDDNGRIYCSSCYEGILEAKKKADDESEVA